VLLYRTKLPSFKLDYIRIGTSTLCRGQHNGETEKEEVSRYRGWNAIDTLLRFIFTHHPDIDGGIGNVTAAGSRL
jgi:hypothetical protein